MPPIEDHPLRYRLANELHARPFPSMQVPTTAAYLAIKRPEGAAARDRQADMDHLIALLDRHGTGQFSVLVPFMDPPGGGRGGSSPQRSENAVCHFTFSIIVDPALLLLCMVSRRAW